MIEGIVSSKLVPTIKLILVGAGAQEHEIEVDIDSGFNNGLSLPREQIQSLGWIFLSEYKTVLGDGRAVSMEYFRGIVMWHGQPRLVTVLASEYTPLIGTALLAGSEMKIQFRPGGKVAISLLP